VEWTAGETSNGLIVGQIAKKSLARIDRPGSFGSAA